MPKFRERFNQAAAEHPSSTIGLAGWKAVILLVLALRAVWSAPGAALTKISESVAVVGRWMQSKPFVQVGMLSAVLSYPLADDLCSVIHNLTAPAGSIEVTAPAFVTPTPVAPPIQVTVPITTAPAPVTIPDYTLPDPNDVIKLPKALEKENARLHNVLGYDEFPQSITRVMLETGDGPRNNGTATLISPTRVLTAQHVVNGEKPENVSIKFYDGRVCKASKVIYYKDTFDLAIVELSEPVDYPVIPISKVDRPEWVCAAGLAGADNQRLFCGKPWMDKEDKYLTFIGEAMPGDSGCGVFAEDGLWGVLSKRSNTGNPRLTQAVPLRDIKAFLAEVDKEGAAEYMAVNGVNRLTIYGTESCGPCQQMKATAKHLREAGYNVVYKEDKEKKFDRYPRLVFVVDGVETIVETVLPEDKIRSVLDATRDMFMAPFEYDDTAFENIGLWQDFEEWYGRNEQTLKALQFIVSIAFVALMFI